jgi:hypothetical protein
MISNVPVGEGLTDAPTATAKTLMTAPFSTTASFRSGRLIMTCRLAGEDALVAVGERLWAEAVAKTPIRKLTVNPAVRIVLAALLFISSP